MLEHVATSRPLEQFCSQLQLSDRHAHPWVFCMAAAAAWLMSVVKMRWDSQASKGLKLLICIDISIHSLHPAGLAARVLHDCPRGL